MNDVEQRVRESLGRHAGSTAVRLMPDRTHGQIRRRKARFVAGAALVAAVGVVAGVGVFRAVPLGDGRPDRAGAPEGSWPNVREGNPGFAFVPEIVGDPEDLTVLVSGTVEGAEFSMVGWTGVAGSEGPCLSFSGPFTPGVAAAPSSGGGFAGKVSEWCAAGTTPPVPDQADLDLLGQTDGSTPDMMANFGFVSPRVARMTVSFGNPPEQVEVELLDGPPGWAGVRSFLFFPPSEVEGTLVAFDDAGRPLARAIICTSRSGVPGGCRGITEPLVLVGPEVPETRIETPAGWPEATLGGPVVPYVDHVVDQDGELDPGIVTPKTVVAFGRVSGIAWTMTGFVSDGAFGATDGPCGEFSLGDEGSEGGGGFCLGSGEEDRALGVSGLGFGRAEITAYTGIVSDAVERVEVRLEGGEVWEPDLLPGPAGWGIRFFVFFPPNGIRGEITAVDAGGVDLASEKMCTEIPDSAGTSSCSG